MLPSFASHYYLPANGPFKSLSNLVGGDDPAFLQLLTRHQREPGYRRRYGRDYIERRRETEATLRKLFIARGGKPKSNYPIYLTLGDSTWFKGLNDDHVSLRVPLSQLDPETTSLTFPDSFMTVTRSNKPYYNKIYFLNEIEQLVKAFGLPANDHLVPYEKYWATDFELYIEIQVWDEPESLSARVTDCSTTWKK